jgi:hypothetical protein
MKNLIKGYGREKKVGIHCIDPRILVSTSCSCSALRCGRFTPLPIDALQRDSNSDPSVGSHSIPVTLSVLFALCVHFHVFVLTF